jgi:predicted RNA binding protein YcfA (HicA-like mRNA interferase family)
MPSETRFAEVKRTLEAAGYRLERIRGSHHVFTKAGASPVVVPVHHGKVKPYYVRQIKKLVEGD